METALLPDEEKVKKKREAIQVEEREGEEWNDSSASSFFSFSLSPGCHILEK